MRNKSYSLILAITLVFISISYLAYRFSGGEFSEKDMSEKNDPVKWQAEQNQEVIEKSNKIENKSTDAEGYNIAEVKENFPEIRKWEKENFGLYISDKDSFEHLYYETEQLEELVKQGDFIAMHVLAQRYLKNLDTENAQRIYEIAAIHGSTIAFASFANHATSSKKSKKDNLMARLPFYQAAILRGDKSFAVTGQVDLEHSGIVLTEQEKNTIRAEGLRIYKNILQARNNQGLGDFDKSVPDYVKKYFYDDIDKNHFNSSNEQLFVLEDS